MAVSKKHMQRLLCCVLVLLGSVAAADEVKLVLDDFDGRQKLSDLWAATGKTSAQRVDAPTDVAGVNGRIMRIKAVEGTRLWMKNLRDLSLFKRVRSIRFQMRIPSATPENPVVFEFRVHPVPSTGWRWRKVVATTGEWQQHDLPLRFFRSSKSSNIAWEETRTFRIYFRQSAVVELDQLELITSDVPDPGYLKNDELVEMAFGDAEVRTAKRHEFAVTTDASDLELPALLSALQDLSDHFAADFPDAAQHERPVPLLIFADKTDYQDFWERFIAAFNSDLSRVQTEEKALLGVTSSYVPLGETSLQPQFVETACQGLLEARLGIGNRHSWLFIGLGKHYRLKRSGLDTKDLMWSVIQKGDLPRLSDFADGSGTKHTEAMAAALFVDWLLREPERRDQFRKAIAKMRFYSSTNLKLVSKECFNKTLEELEDAWLAWARK